MEFHDQLMKSRSWYTRIKQQKSIYALKKLLFLQEPISWNASLILLFFTGKDCFENKIQIFRFFLQKETL